MHVVYIPENGDYWFQYYKTSVTSNPQYQLGGELQGFRAYSPYHRGAGLGSFFRSLFRMAMPLLKSAGKQTLAAGSKIAADVVQGRPLKESALEHGKHAAGEVLHDTADRIQKGKGIGQRKKTNTVKPYKRRASNKVKSVVKKKSRRTVALKKDVFEK
jgi:hypothetical protein